MTDAPLDESLNPIWVLLSRGGMPNLWMRPTGGEAWETSLVQAADEVGDGELIVSVARPLARSLLARATGRGGLSTKGPGPAEIEDALERAGLDVVASYVLWPSARSPRVAFPRSRMHMLFWLQTSGVLGGGGNRLWARALARSVVFTPAAAVLSPGVAYVVRRTRREET
jgi:hypothetical protein